MLRNLSCRRLGLDEIWCFCYAKDKNLPDSMKGMPGVGSMWTWTAIDAETKVVPSWRLGARDAANAHAFISDLADRLAGRVQLTSDGNRVYVDAVEEYLGGSVDYAMLIKQYGQNESPERAYSPAKCLGAKKKQIDGKRQRVGVGPWPFSLDRQAASCVPAGDNGGPRESRTKAMGKRKQGRSAPLVASNACRPRSS